MFNDLNQAQNNDQARPAVDDIFADTDKAASQPLGQMPQASNGIETRNVGLTAGAGDEVPVENNSGPWCKIAVISIIVVILGLGGYLAYSNFMKPQAEVEAVIDFQAPLTETPVEEQLPAEELPPLVEENLAATTTATTSMEIIPLIPGVNTPDMEAGTTTSLEPVAPITPIDSDSDGLSDPEEAAAGTNMNIMDTDADGLSDYEEIKIYGTNPLLADSDGDTYPDGDEIKNGYNPLGAGKLGE